MSKLKNLIKNKNFKIYLIFGVIVLVLISAAAFVAMNLTPKDADTKTETKKNSLDPDGEISLIINKNSIQPSEITLKEKKLYTINLTKSDEATCTALRLEDLDLQVDTLGSRTFPLRLDVKGKYKMNCIDSSLSFNIKVE